jgi:hypothetical protein
MALGLCRSVADVPSKVDFCRQRIAQVCAGGAVEALLLDPQPKQATHCVYVSKAAHPLLLLAG